VEIINALVRNTIDYHRAQLILLALHIEAKIPAMSTSKAESARSH
jgi:hypothetical protein